MSRKAELALFYASKGCLQTYFEKGTIEKRLRDALRDQASTISTTRGVPQPFLVVEDGEEKENQTTNAIEANFVKPKRGTEPRNPPKSISARIENNPPGIRNQENARRFLLLLHHAGTCSCTSNECTIYRCAEMKKVWKHMQSCVDKRCTLRTCRYGRVVLCHSYRCRKKFQCQICGPVLRKKILDRNRRQICEVISK